MEGILYFLTTPDPSRPIEEKYVSEVNGVRKSFLHKEDALLFLYDEGVRTYRFLTKEINEYAKGISKLPVYKFWKIKNRIGYVLYDFESYIDEDNTVKKRKAYVWRFVGFGRSCFAKTPEELRIKVTEFIDYYEVDPENVGYNTYPYYTKHYR